MSILSFLPSFGQDKPITFTHYTQAEGLSNNWIFSILQDGRGFLWIGTWNGLNKFDGKEFRKYHYKKGSVDSPGGKEIKSLAQDTRGMIWLGTENGVCRLNPLTDKFSHLRFDESFSAKLSFYGIHSLSDDRDRGTIFAGGNGLFMAAYDTETLVPVPGGMNESLFFGTNHIINSILMDDNRLWLGTSIGIIVFNIENHTWQKLDFSGDQEFLNGLDFINSIFIDGDGTLWAASWGAGLIKADTARFTMTEYFLPQEQFRDASHNILNGITYSTDKGEEDLLWISGVTGGLFSFDKLTGSFQNYGSSVPDEPGKIYQAGYPVLFLPETGLWIGTKLGLYRYDPRQQLVTELEINNGKTSSVFYNPLHADPADPTGNTIWLGSNNKGLYRYNILTNEFRLMNSSFGNLLTPEIYISDMYFDSNGTMWIASLLNGLIKHDPAAKNTMRFRFLNRSGDTVSWINEICGQEKDGDNIRIATDGGLFTINKRSGNYRQVFIFHENHDLSDASVFSTAWRNGNELVILGVDKNSGEEFIASLPPSGDTANIIAGPFPESAGRYLNMTGLAVSSSGKIIIGSYDGLFYYDDDASGDNVLLPFALNEQVSNSRVDQLITDPNGMIWAQIAGDPYCLDPQTGDLFTLSLEKLQKNAGFRFHLNEISGNMMAGTWNKVYIIRNDSNLISREPAKKFITGIRIGTGYYKNSSHDYTDRELTLPFDSNNVTVEYTAVNYVPGTSNQYAVRMKGFNDAWTFTGNESVSYKLPPGKYRFELRAANAFGIWDDSIVYTGITILPPFYRTWWFALLVILLIFSLVIAVYRYRINQLLKLQKMRDNISRDLHDDIGSSLTNIAIMNELAVQETRRGGDTERILRKSAEDIHEIISSLSDIVWNVNPKYDDLKFLLARMRWYASELLDNTDIRYTLDIREPDEKTAMNMEQRRDLYLLFKEGLNNLVKYSEASNAVINILVENNTVLMKIRDDGKGFIPESIEFGNGLKNMRQRTEAWNGNFKVNSKPGNGTELNFFIPIKN